MVRNMVIGIKDSCKTVVSKSDSGQQEGMIGHLDVKRTWACVGKSCFACKQKCWVPIDCSLN